MKSLKNIILISVFIPILSVSADCNLEKFYYPSPLYGTIIHSDLSCEGYFVNSLGFLGQEASSKYTAYIGADLLDIFGEKRLIATLNNSTWLSLPNWSSKQSLAILIREGSKYKSIFVTKKFIDSIPWGKYAKNYLRENSLNWQIIEVAD